MVKGSDKLVVPSSPRSNVRLQRLSSTYLSQLPFETTLSLDPLIEHWQRTVETGDRAAVSLFRDVEGYLQDHPELRGALGDPAILRDHESFLQLLTQPIMPSAYGEEIASAIIVPFEYRMVYSTPAFKRLFTQEEGIISGQVNLDLRTFTYGRTISAYLHILRTIYGLDVTFDYPVTFTTEDPDTGLSLHFKVATDLKFVRINKHGNVPELDKKTTRSLLANVSELSDWMRLIPPSSFEFYGLGVIRAHDVTDERMVGMLQRDLSEEGNLVTRGVLPDIENHVRTLLQMPHLELGLAAIDERDFYLLNEPVQPLVDTFFLRSTRYDISALEGSTFDRCLDERSIQVVEDLELLEERAAIEDDLLRWGVRNIIAAPLIVQDERVGVLYLWAVEPASLSALNVMKLLDLLPIFSAAVNRVREEMRNRVENVMMGQYTSIHPAVEWRFRKAAMNSIQKQEGGGVAEVEPIVFENVFPLFAATDIRASSEHRNEAIRRDLLDHLQLAHDALSQARDKKPAAMFSHLLAKISRHQNSIERSLASGNEASVRDFLQHDLGPILVNLKGLGNRLDRSIDRFQLAADPEAGTLYRRSRAFEKSVQQINTTIADYLDREQANLQSQIPHYFEKHQTDGVDFTMYVGSSLVENEQYSSSNVNILRLWQLMVMCGIALSVRSLRDELEVPLQTTHLVLVQDTPISIRYRFDEARFDVAGPQHVRFEIMKQRVEKARIQGTQERLTQPDRIAIVYSQNREASEYTSYLTFLRERGFVASDIESLRLGDLQGMKGLRALRVGVGAESADKLPPINPGLLQEAVSALTID